MSDEIFDIKAGTVVVFTSGEYFDFGINAILVAVEDISHATIKEIADGARAEAVKANAEWSDYSISGSSDNFIPALIKRGSLVAVNTREIWLGGYGDLEIAK